MAQEIQKQSANSAQEQKELTDALMLALAKSNQMQPTAQKEDGTIDMIELFFHVLSKIHYVILAAVLGTVLAYLYVHFYYTPTYEATAKLYIQNTSGISVSVGDMQVASNLTNDYQEVFRTWNVSESVRLSMIERTAAWGEPGSTFGSYSDSEFDEHHLSVSNPSNTRVLYISIEHPRGEVAIEIANAYAEAAMQFILEHMGNAYEPTKFSAAKYAEPVGMGKTKCLILGFMGGILLALMVLVLMFIMDDRPHTPDDIAKVADIPTLAVVPKEQNIRRSRSRAQMQHKGEKK